MSATLKERDVSVLWNDDENEAYYEIAERAQADRCQCYRLVATGRDLLQLRRFSTETAAPSRLASHKNELEGG